jgi:membrane dipeptidase
MAFFGFSVRLHNLVCESSCIARSFCQMIEEAARRYGAQNLGVGTDLC